MLVLLIVAATVVVGVAIALISRGMSYGDDHSVEGYHRQLHTLEQIKTHSPDAPKEEGAEGEAKPNFPESTVRIAGSPNVRVTDGPNAVPPVPPPPVAEPDKPVTFDDATPIVMPTVATAASETFTFGRKDKAMEAMNRRPRRVAGPVVAVGSVAVLIVVLVLAGSHKVTPPKHHETAGSTVPTSTKRSHDTKKRRTQHTTTSTTQPPIVSLPRATSLNSANYTVGPADYTLVVSATSGRCWVEVMNATTGATLFEQVMSPGQQQSISATGPVTVDIGAPNSFSATIDGKAVVLPYGYQTPFSMNFVPVGSSSASTATTTTVASSSNENSPTTTTEPTTTSTTTPSTTTTTAF
jgi:uncharacterized protein DUF4115